VGLKPLIRKLDLFQYRVWTPGELRRFLSIAREDESYEYFRTVAMTGMRRGEGAGLRWIDFTPDFSRVAVARSMNVVGGRSYITMPKSGFVRTVELDEQTASELQALKSGRSKSRPDDYVFLRNGDVPNPGYYTKHFKDLVKRDPDLHVIRLHDLRHTHASHMILAGANIKAVQERLGHADVVITLNLYSHVSRSLAPGCDRKRKGQTRPVSLTRQRFHCSPLLRLLVSHMPNAHLRWHTVHTTVKNRGRACRNCVVADFDQITGSLGNSP
jgi:integrase